MLFVCVYTCTYTYTYIIFPGEMTKRGDATLSVLVI